MKMDKSTKKPSWSTTLFTAVGVGLMTYSTFNHTPTEEVFEFTIKASTHEENEDKRRYSHISDCDEAIDFFAMMSVKKKSSNVEIEPNSSDPELETSFSDEDLLPGYSSKMFSSIQSLCFNHKISVGRGSVEINEGPVREASATDSDSAKTFNLGHLSSSDAASCSTVPFGYSDSEEESRKESSTESEVEMESLMEFLRLENEVLENDALTSDGEATEDIEDNLPTRDEIGDAQDIDESAQNNTEPTQDDMEDNFPTRNEIEAAQDIDESTQKNIEATQDVVKGQQDISRETTQCDGGIEHQNKFLQLMKRVLSEGTYVPNLQFNQQAEPVNYSSSISERLRFWRPIDLTRCSNECGSSTGYLADYSEISVSSDSENDDFKPESFKNITFNVESTSSGDAFVHEDAKKCDEFLPREALYRQLLDSALRDENPTPDDKYDSDGSVCGNHDLFEEDSGLFGFEYDGILARPASNPMVENLLAKQYASKKLQETKELVKRQSALIEEKKRRKSNIKIFVFERRSSKK